MTSAIAPPAPACALRPVRRYSLTSSMLQAPRPVRSLAVRSGATQLSRVPPWKAGSDLSAPSALFGVWQPPQWPKPSTRYAPRFHSGDWLGSALNAFEFKYKRFQPFTKKRFPSGNIRLLPGGVYLTAGVVFKKAQIASASSRLTSVNQG